MCPWFDSRWHHTKRELNRVLFFLFLFCGDGAHPKQCRADTYLQGSGNYRLYLTSNPTKDGQGLRRRGPPRTTGPKPLACIRLSGITSRSKWASLSVNQGSCKATGPLTPAVSVFWLSAMGRPFSAVKYCLSLCFIAKIWEYLSLWSQNRATHQQTSFSFT